MPPRPRDFDRSPFTKPLTRKRSRRELKAATRLAFGPQKRALKKEIKGTRLSKKRIRQYFPNYRESIGEAASRTQAAYGQAQQEIGAASQSAANFAEQVRQRMAQEAMEDAARRGVAYDPSGSQTGAQANLARMNTANVLRGVTSAQGASQQAMFADKGRIAQREKIEQLLRADARKRSLQGERRDLLRDQGAFRADQLRQMRGEERDYLLGLMAAGEPGKARRFQAKENRKSRRFDRKQAAKNRKADSKGGGGSGSKKDRRQNKRETKADIARLRSKLESAKPKQQRRFAENKRATIRKLVDQGRGFSKLEARKAYKRWRKNSGIYGPFKD